MGNAGGESQQKLLIDLNDKVKDVYRRCMTDDDGDLGTLQMLTLIESRLEELFETIESMPREKVEQAEKVYILIMRRLKKRRDGKGLEKKNLRLKGRFRMKEWQKHWNEHMLPLKKLCITS